MRVHDVSLTPRVATRSFRSTGVLASMLGLLALAGCGSGGAADLTSSNAINTIVAHPVGTDNFIVEVNRGGQAAQLKLLGAFWGRQVDVFDESDPVNARFRDFVISKNLISIPNVFVLDRNPITGKETLTILNDNTSNPPIDRTFGTPAFRAALDQASTALQTLLVKGLDPTEPPPFTMVARNSVLVLLFDDLIDEDSLSASTIQVLTGIPASAPFEPRLLIDRGHGDTLGNEFLSTRVIVDFTISELEKLVSPIPLSVNNVGLPEAAERDVPNILIRIPSFKNLAVGQFQILSNPAGNGIGFTGNGPTDPSSPTLDVVRAFRSGGSNVFPGGADEFNGFLPDFVKPEILGSQSVNVGNISAQGNGEFLVDLNFATVGCAVAPSIGDVIELPTVQAQVIQPSPPPAPGSGLVSGVRVRQTFGAAPNFIGGDAVYLLPYDPVAGDVPECFVRFAPDALAAPAGGVLPNSSVVVRFSEPMDPGSYSAFKSFAVTKPPAPSLSLLEENVVGQIERSLDLTEYRFVPIIGMEHAQGSAEGYQFDVRGGSGGVTDLAGNVLLSDLPMINFSLNPGSASLDTYGFGLRFEVVNGGGQDGLFGPEIRGQFLADVQNARIMPRTPSRFSAVALPVNLTVGAMSPFGMPIATPLAPLGSHMQTVWRYHDLGFTIQDESNFNIDVEGVAWQPFSPPSIDTYNEYQILLSHSRRQPDEAVDSLLVPQFPNSGLSATYATNRLGPQVTVHDRTLGYTVNPLDQFTTSTGTTLMPWPINGGFPFDGNKRPLDQFTRFTYRNTELTATGGNSSGGADTAQLCFLSGGAVGSTCMAGQPWPPGKVPTVGLPIMMEFRCYPDSSAFGLNGFQIALALTTSPNPDFRAYSTGGFDTAGVPQTVDPDSDPLAIGGFVPATGASTVGCDNSFYYGQADFVVRVNVVHTIWFDTGAAGNSSQFFPPSIEPTAATQPPGTGIVVRYRGATSVTGDLLMAPSADDLTPYGDPDTSMMQAPGTVTFLNNDSLWKPAIALVDGARFIQARITLLSNVNSLTPSVPTLSALGIAALR